MKAALRSWCKRHGINHREYSDGELIKFRTEQRSTKFGGFRINHKGGNLK